MTGLWLMRDKGSGRGGRAVAWRHEALRHEAVVLGGAGGGTVSHEPGEPPATGHWAHSARWVGLRNLPPVLSPARLPLCVLLDSNPGSLDACPVRCRPMVLLCLTTLTTVSKAS